MPSMPTGGLPAGGLQNMMNGMNP